MHVSVAVYGSHSPRLTGSEGGGPETEDSELDLRDTGDSVPAVVICVNTIALE